MERQTDGNDSGQFLLESNALARVLTTWRTSRRYLERMHLWQISPHYNHDYKRLHDIIIIYLGTPCENRMKENCVKNSFCNKSRVISEIILILIPIIKFYIYIYLRFSSSQYITFIIYTSLLFIRQLLSFTHQRFSFFQLLFIYHNYSWTTSAENIFLKFEIIFLLIFPNVTLTFYEFAIRKC